MRAHVYPSLLAILTALLLASCAHAAAQAPGATPDTALAIDLAPGTMTLPAEGSYLLNASTPDAYFALRGLGGGMKLTIKVEAVGAEQGRSIIELYSGEGGLLRRAAIVYGEGTKAAAELVHQPSRESASPDSAYQLSLKRYSGSMKYRVVLVVEPVEDYAPGTGDAGAGPEDAVNLPALATNESMKFRGFLASRDQGDDFADCYRVRAVFASSGDVLMLAVRPAGDLQVSASLYREDYLLRSNASRGRGEPVTLSISGEWEGGREYQFILRVDNSGGRGGGEYEVEAWIEPAPPEQAPGANQGAAGPMQPGFSEDLVKILVMAGAAALVAISIAALILRRRRIYRVEEVEWWGGLV